MILTIESENNPKVNIPQHFPIKKKASLASGISVSSIRSTRATMSPLTRKTTGYTYTITWLTLRVKDQCINCSTPLISEDRTQKFMINDDFDFAEMFSTIYKAAQGTGISYDALKHASMSGKSTITRRARTTGIDKHARKVYSITWNPRCRSRYGVKFKNNTR